MERHCYVCALSVPDLLIWETVTVRKTRRERLNSALYLRLEKGSFKICVGRFHEKLLFSILRLLFSKTRYTTDITSKIRIYCFTPDITSKFRIVLKKIFVGVYWENLVSDKNENFECLMVLKNVKGETFWAFWNTSLSQNIEIFRDKKFFGEKSRKNDRALVSFGFVCYVKKGKHERGKGKPLALSFRCPV